MFSTGFSSGDRGLMFFGGIVGLGAALLSWSNRSFGELDGVVRWRRIDLKRVIEERFGVIYSERTISDLLAVLCFSHISGRPQHPKQDQRVIEAFKKTFPTRWRPT